MLLKTLVKSFVEQRPYCVMVRASLERMLSPSRLDQIFHDHAVEQYERELLFSSLVEVMARVVTRIEPSVLSSYRALKDKLGVSDEAIYQKLRLVETTVSEAMVRDSFANAAGVLQQLGADDASWVGRRRVKILDGNYLQATERRIAELRTMWDAPLPGRALVVWDQQTRLVENVFLTEHGLASERSLIQDVLKTVAAGDVWIADRNFCTLGFLFGLAARQAHFVIRQHGQLQGILQGNRLRVGETDKGEPVWEQAVTITYEGKQRTIRRITVELKQPTRDGDKEIHIFTNLTAREVSATKVAELYAKRWTIEVVFLELQTALRCEVHTLGYPRAALFAFCVALLLQNTFSMLQGSLRSVHGQKTVDEQVSAVLLSQELRKTYDGMMVQVPPVHWEEISYMPLKSFASLLKEWAQQMDLTRYRKTPRGPKIPQPKRTPRSKGGRVSTMTILKQRRPPP
jgi:IS4 transposase